MKGLPFLVVLEMGGLFCIQHLFTAAYLAAASMNFASAFGLSKAYTSVGLLALCDLRGGVRWLHIIMMHPAFAYTIAIPREALSSSYSL